MQERRGVVKSLTGSEALVEMDDGTERTLNVPEMISVEVGMSVRIVDVGDDQPIIAWGV
jgi:hypothetical protein